MRAPGRRAPGRTFGDAIAIVGPSGDWSGLTAQLDRNGAAIIWARQEDWRPELVALPRLHALLGDDWERYLALTHPQVRSRFAASRLLLKAGAAAVLGVRPQSVELGYSLTGRPVLRGYDGVHISLSHTEDVLLVGLAIGGAIGVDAESSDRVMYGPDLGRHMCTPYEVERIQAMPVAERNSAVVRLWTLKEAYTKAVGLGMALRFTDFGFSPDRAPTDVLGPDGTPCTIGGWAFHTRSIGDRFTIGIAVGDDGFGLRPDTTVDTVLHQGTVDALVEALGEEEQETNAVGEW